MKRIRMAMLGLAWLACLGFFAAGCEDDSGPDNWAFQNNSSYRVTVRPNGQHWAEVMVDPGHTVDVEFNGDQIQYIYTPSNKVRAQGGDGRIVHFYNR